MKRFLLLLSVFFVLFSCQNEYQPRKNVKISIEQAIVPNSSIRAVQIVDAFTAFYAGSNGKFGYRTTDGIGVSKAIEYQDSINPYFRSIAYNGTSLFALSIAAPALLFKIERESFDYELVYSESHEKVFYDSMKFFDSQNGIAMGDPTEDCLSIIVTKDGGNTWNKIPCEKLPKVAEGEAAFAASNTNIKVLGKTAWIVTGGTKSRVFKTTDLGETWEVFDTPIIQGEGAQGIYSVDFADENNGIIIGGDYSKPEQNVANKAITKDGGKTWELVADGQNPSYKSCVQYVPDTNGQEVVAVGRTGISYSYDGGITWKELSSEGYYVIQFADRYNAWMAGNEKIARLTLK
jgi:hypothetical protein